MSVDEALKYVISMGVVAPPARVKAAARSNRRCRREQPTVACTPSQRGGPICVEFSNERSE